MSFMSAAAVLFQKVYSIIYKILAAIGASLVGSVDGDEKPDRI